MTDEVLSQLEQESRKKQEAFMKRIADRLGHSQLREKPRHPYQGAPSFWDRFELSQEERITLFSENWSKAGGHVVKVGSMEEAKRWMTEKAAEMKAKRMLRQNQPELQSMRLEAAMKDAEWIVWDGIPKADRLAAAASADIGLVVADHAVAYTGSLVVTSSAKKGRSVSLLPAALFAVVPADRMCTRLGEVLRPIDRTPRERLPAGIHFISGPSRSADIENDLTIGVHGPGVVFAIIVG